MLQIETIGEYLMINEIFTFTDDEQVRFDLWSKEEIYHSFILSDRLGKEAQDRFNREVEAHALTRSKYMDMVVEKLKRDEMDYIMEASERFYESAGIPRESGLRAHYERLRGLKDCFVFTEIGKGFIVGFIAPSILEPGKLQAQEIAWWVEPEFRKTGVAIKLIKKYENEAIKRGANYIGMAALSALDLDGVETILHKMGYNNYEKHYRKEI